MNIRSKNVIAISAVLALASIALGQNTPTGNLTTGDGPYVPGVTYQADNPNYLNRNPFFFEGRVDWNLLKITNPSTPWEFLQRGIHYQDDLEDYVSAKADYQKALSMNSLSNGTCQIFTGPVPVSPNVNPPGCMFTPRLRLAHLVIEDEPDVAIELYQEVLQIDALRLGVHELIAEAWEVKAKKSADEASKEAFLEKAIEEYEAEMALSPVTEEYTRLTADKANNAHAHWALAEIYSELGNKVKQAEELQAYLDATQWHSDTYAWRIPLAKARLAKLGH